MVQNLGSALAGADEPAVLPGALPAVDEPDDPQAARLNTIARQRTIVNTLFMFPHPSFQKIIILYNKKPP